MKSERLNELIVKFLNGAATESETDELNMWYRQKSQNVLPWFSNHSDEEYSVKKRMLNKLQEHIQSDTTTRPLYSKLSFRMTIAAACVLFLLSFLMYFFSVINGGPEGTVIVSNEQAENRYLLLPDSSKVILRPGTQLTYKYSKSERHISLNGEGYFEVKGDSEWPFIVKTGEIATRVVGTSFNIEAYSEKEVVVSVHTGEVSVIDETKKTLAVLKPNQQMQYKRENRKIDTKSIEIGEQMSWVKTDMQFVDVPLPQLISSMNRRYNADIEIKNNKMDDCLITGTFDGTEALEEVLDILTLTTGATYSVIEGKVILEGGGC